MTDSKKLMADARPTWHAYWEKAGRDHRDEVADALYDAYLAGFEAGQKVTPPPPTPTPGEATNG